MTANPNPIPEPTFPTEIVVGKRDGVTLVAVRIEGIEDRSVSWAVQHPDGGLEWYDWPELREELTDIRVVDVGSNE